MCVPFVFVSSIHDKQMKFFLPHQSSRLLTRLPLSALVGEDETIIPPITISGYFQRSLSTVHNSLLHTVQTMDFVLSHQNLISCATQKTAYSVQKSFRICSLLYSARFSTLLASTRFCTPLAFPHRSLLHTARICIARFGTPLAAYRSLLTARICTPHASAHLWHLHTLASSVHRSLLYIACFSTSLLHTARICTPLACARFCLHIARFSASVFLHTSRICTALVSAHRSYLHTHRFHILLSSVHHSHLRASAN